MEGDLDARIEQHIESWLTPSVLFDLSGRFQRDGFIKVREIYPDEIRESVREEVLLLLEKNAERRDLLLETTGNTPRFMSVVRSEFIAAQGELINRLYRSQPLIAALERIAGEKLYACPAADEEFLITRQEKKGDTHGWHWGDFSFALIGLIDTPPLEVGGMLQCVPHTKWDKSNPRIHEYLCANPITTYGFVPGDFYFLRTDTTLHRTVPLNEDARRIILNLTWAGERDLRGAPKGDDRWWENSEAQAASAVQD
ncbi:HalD/BesD family halogenase [Streptomyces daliensis]